MKYHMLLGVGVNCTAMRSVWLGLIALSLFSHSAAANERDQAWQKTRPFTQSAWRTHRYQGGEEIDVPYFVGSGLNTFWDAVRSGSSRSKHPFSMGLPALTMANRHSLDKFVKDFKLAQAAHPNLVVCHV